MKIILIVAGFVNIYFGVGVAILAKSLGLKYWFLAILPFGNFYFLGKIAGTYRVLSVPVKKSLGFYIEVMIVFTCCLLYLIFAITRFGAKEDAAMWIRQIMYVPLICCLGLIYLAMIKSSIRIYRRYHVEKQLLYSVLSILILPIPILYYIVKDREAMKLEEMFF